MQVALNPSQFPTQLLIENPVQQSAVKLELQLIRLNPKFKTPIPSSGGEGGIIGVVNNRVELGKIDAHKELSDAVCEPVRPQQPCPSQPPASDCGSSQRQAESNVAVRQELEVLDFGATKHDLRDKDSSAVNRLRRGR